MKSATVTLGLFAALTSAYSHPRHMHFRRQNLTAPAASTLSSLTETAGYATFNPDATVSSATAPSGTASAVETSAPVLSVNSTSSLLPLNGTSTKAGGALTTLTVIATSVETITSCAATITNCPTRPEDLATLPSEALSTVLVTQTKVITEVTCPVSEASSIQSSILASASSTPPVLTDTTASHVISTETVTLTHVATITSSKVVTITLGGDGGNGKPHVVTSTIKTQVESTVEEVVTKTVSHDAVVVPTKNAEIDSTTTMTSTTTGTRTMTVPGVATETVSPGGDSGNGTGGGSGGNHGGNGNGGGLEDSNNAVCSCPPVAAAVTVTHTAAAIAPVSTVYVTIKETVHPTAPAPLGKPITKTMHAGKGKGKGKTTTSADAVATSESACPPDEIVTVTGSDSATASETGIESAAPTLAPFPASNSSSIAPTGGAVPITSLSYH